MDHGLELVSPILEILDRSIPQSYPGNSGSYDTYLRLCPKPFSTAVRAGGGRAGGVGGRGVGGWGSGVGGGGAIGGSGGRSLPAGGRADRQNTYTEGM